jgi:dihydrofolate reductase
MGKIRVHEFVSLDGVFEDPRWTAPFGFDPKMGAAIAEVTGSSAAILLGRVTFQMFAPAWSTRSPDDDPGVPFFNDTPKFVVSGTLESADEWQHSTVLGGYDADAVRELKQRVDGDIYVSGSGTLVRALLADGLVDELNLFVYPIVLGRGVRLFPEGTPRVSLALDDTERYSNGVILLRYAPGSQ